MLKAKEEGGGREGGLIQYYRLRKWREGGRERGREGGM